MRGQCWVHDKNNFSLPKTSMSINGNNSRGRKGGSNIKPGKRGLQQSSHSRLSEGQIPPPLPLSSHQQLYQEHLLQTSATINTRLMSMMQASESLEDQEEDDDHDPDNLKYCFICTEPIKIYALGSCDHRYCHLCSLRLRALYKDMKCSMCKVYLQLKNYVLSHSFVTNKYQSTNYSLSNKN